MAELTHLKETGEASMVDVSNKPDTFRHAVACAEIAMQPATLDLITSGDMPKGDVLAVARVAGIQAAKKTSDLIPLCHPLPITEVRFDFERLGEARMRITCSCKVTGKTGVEMEALTGASIAALTIYDMCKAIEKGMCIEDVHLISKSGGKSGEWSAR